MSSTASSFAVAAPHPWATRLIHASLATAICVQLGTSLIMTGPRAGQAGDLFYQIHRYSGFVALALALLFWINTMSRRKGTALAALVPWFSQQRRAAFFGDMMAHLRAAMKLRLPPYDEHGAFASGIHGLGLLLMSAMALSGTVYALQVAAGQIGVDPEAAPVMLVHYALANLVWVYLIGHAALATLHHVMRASSLSRMWSLRR